MKPAALLYHDMLDFAALPAGADEHPLARRMTPLQLTVAALFERLQRGSPDFWRDTMLSDRCRVYYATSLGEGQTMASLSAQVLDEDFPLSPRDFQNSVHNAAPGCATIVTGLTAGVVTTTTGYLAADLTLLLAARRLGPGQDLALVVNGDELGTGGARAEMYLLGHGRPPPSPSFSHRLTLVEVEWCHGETACAVKAEGAGVVCREGSGPLPWLGEALPGLISHGGSRVVMTEAHQAVWSRWVTP